MTVIVQSDLFIRNPREAEIAARADQLAQVFAQRAAQHDADGSFPFENFEDLKQSDYLKLTVPCEFGGEGASLYEMVLAQEHLARGDGSTALAVGWHVSKVLQLRTSQAWPASLFEQLCHDIIQHGWVINELASEPATGSPSRGGRPETTAQRVEGGWVISGRKTFSTLSPILQHFVVTAGIEGSEKVGAFLVRGTDGVHIEETWNTLGMRSTGSHDVIMDYVFVPDSAVIRGLNYQAPANEPDAKAGSLLHVPACYLGIAHGARDFALDFARNYRPNSLSTSIAELPHIKRQIAQMEVDLISARTFVYHMADRWDREPDQRAAIRPELGLAKYIATNAALNIVDQAMRIVGGSSLSRNLPLERMYRDVRAGLHNPPMDDTVLTNLANRAIAEG